MRRIDKEKILERLDEIEALTSIPGRDGNAYDIGLPGIDSEARNLMLKAARDKGSVKQLLEKYSGSRSVIIENALGSVLGRCTKRTKLKDAYLLFENIEKLQRKDIPAILGGTLSSIKVQIWRAKVWQQTPMPKILYPFLQHCLEFTSEKATWTHRGLADWVELGALDLLWTMCEHKIYNLNFNESQRKWIEDKIKEIAEANPDNKTFQRNTLYFFDCLNKQV